MDQLREKIEKIIESEYLDYSGKGVGWHVKATTRILSLPEMESLRLKVVGPLPDPPSDRH